VIFQPLVSVVVGVVFFHLHAGFSQQQALQPLFDGRHKVVLVHDPAPDPLVVVDLLVPNVLNPVVTQQVEFKRFVVKEGIRQV